MSATRRTHSSEFKSEAVELATRSGRSIAEVERELGLSEGLLKQRVRKAKRDGEQHFPATVA
ncbi:MAG: transposase [Caldilinea sp.]|nr:transposase [Caldilinea sp.]MDW8439111.1 transposase [Caldilineaceae bacterium]